MFWQDVDVPISTWKVAWQRRLRDNQTVVAEGTSREDRGHDVEEPQFTRTYKVKVFLDQLA